MAWLYHRSASWRKVVSFSARSSLHFAMFGTACFAGAWYLGDAVMSQTNPEQDAAREALLRKRASLDHQILARANRERLAVLLNEVQDKTKSAKDGEERYAAALRGESLGTHSKGTTVGAVAIKKNAADD